MPSEALAVLGAHLDPEDAYSAADVLGDLPETYASFVALAEVPGGADNVDGSDVPMTPAEMVAEYLFDTYEWEGESPSPEALAEWAEEHADEIAGHVPWERSKLKRDRLLDGFHELRREGKTVVQAAKKLDAEPQYLVHLAATDKNDFRAEATKRAHAAQREHERYRGAVARRRMLGAMATKLEKELRSRDLSDLPTKDLAHLLLKLAEVARDEEPPTLGVAVGFKTV